METYVVFFEGATWGVRVGANRMETKAGYLNFYCDREGDREEVIAQFAISKVQGWMIQRAPEPISLAPREVDPEVFA